MKQLFLSCLLIPLLLLNYGAVAQYSDTLPTRAEKLILDQAESIKKELRSKGFLIIRESGLKMESQYDIPIVLQLEQGTWYHLVFIGEITSKLYEARMYDWGEKQVIFDQKRWGDIDGNVLNYSYIPKFTEFHLLRLVQVNRQKKNLFGYAMIFKKNYETQNQGKISEDNATKTL